MYFLRNLSRLAFIINFKVMSFDKLRQDGNKIGLGQLAHSNS